MLLDIFDPKAPPRPIGIDLGTTNSIVAYVQRPQARGHRDLRRHGAPAERGPLRRGRDRHGGSVRPCLSDAEPRAHHRERQALHGARRRRSGDAPPGCLPVRPSDLGGGAASRPFRSRRSGGDSGGGERGDPPEPQAERGWSPQDGGRRGHHRARLLRRRPAPGHPGRGTPRRARGAAAPERTDRRGPRVRARPPRKRPLRRVRPGRRHLRHHTAPARGRCLPGQEHGRRQRARR